MDKLKKDILECLRRNSIEFPEKSAFTIIDGFLYEIENIKYKELLFKVEELGSQSELRVTTGKCAVLYYHSVIDFVIAFLACQKAGIIPIPVQVSNGFRQFIKVVNILRDSSAATILTTQDLKYKVRTALSDYPDYQEITVISTDVFDTTATLDDTREIKQNISFIQYTSGSTNSPKGVVITKESLMHNQKLLTTAFGCSKDSRIFTWLPFHHDMGLVGNILHTIYAGCTCIVMSPLQFLQRPLSWLEAISRYKITHSGGPNFAYDLCVDKISNKALQNLDLSSWAVAYNGSDYVRLNTLTKFYEHCKNWGFRMSAFHPCYGLAEATLVVAGTKSHEDIFSISISTPLLARGEIVISESEGDDCQQIVSVGEVIEGATVKIIGKEDKLEYGELQPGEICVSGKSVSSAYWRKKIEDSYYEINHEQYLRTGDIGFFFSNQLFVCGRYKELLVIRGKNIYPHDIEQVVADVHPAIHLNGVAAFTLDDHSDKLVILAEIKRSFLQADVLSEVLSLIDARVSEFFGVSPYDVALTIQASIPKTTSGKLQRVKCREYFVDNRLNVILRKKNSTAVEDLVLDFDVQQDMSSLKDFQVIEYYVLDLIRKVLSLESSFVVDREMNLAGLGIDSIRVVQIAGKINADFDINLDPAKLFEEKTVNGVIKLIECLLWIKNSPLKGKEIIL